MKGLLIKAYWGHKILKGEKTWEIRGTNTSHRGHTEIIYSGTGQRRRQKPGSINQSWQKKGGEGA